MTILSVALQYYIHLRLNRDEGWKNIKGAINILIAVYKKEFRLLGGYLTDSSKPNLSRVEHFIQAVASYEDKIFQKRVQMHQRQAQRVKRDKAQTKRGNDRTLNRGQDLAVLVRFQGSRIASTPIPSPYDQTRKPTKSSTDTHCQSENFRCLPLGGATINTATFDAENNTDTDIEENKEDLKFKLKVLLWEKTDVFNSENAEEDTVKLGQQGWRRRYYEEKFSATTRKELDEIHKDVVLRYTEGLCWVMHYYYEGVCSWKCDGMNGYLSLCYGDPVPFVFRSPIEGMEDIMNNQVICSIYRLPDPHKHISQPSSGVVFPKKIVMATDLKPAPVLWHDDYTSRPNEHRRQRGFSGVKSGVVAHRQNRRSLPDQFLVGSSVKLLID